jgi:peptidoglycan-associated lipoprotein
MLQKMQLVFIGLMILLLVAAGCQKKTTKGVEPQPLPSVEQPAVPSTDKELQKGTTEEMEKATETKLPLQFEKIYFEFDKYTLPNDQRNKLAENAEVLKAYPEVKVLIEGNCDERGTIEYNLSLGEKRANTLKEYLINYGISASRLSTISYGEEKPVDPGKNEQAWAKNRRGEFTITQR